MDKLIPTLLGFAGIVYINTINAQLIPSKHYTLKETIELIKEYNEKVLGGKYNSNHNICIDNLTLGGKPFIIHANDFTINFFNDRSRPRNEKEIKEAEKNKETNYLSYKSKNLYYLNDFLESEINKHDELEKRKDLEAQAITKK